MTTVFEPVPIASHSPLSSSSLLSLPYKGKRSLSHFARLIGLSSLKVGTDAMEENGVKTIPEVVEVSEAVDEESLLWDAQVSYR